MSVSKILKVIDFIIYWSIILMPFGVAIAPGVANAFIGIFIVFYIIKKIIKRQWPSLDRAVLFAFLCFFVVALVSFKNSISYANSFNGLIKLLKGLLIFMVCCEEIRDKKHIIRIVFAACCGVVLLAVDAFWQIKFGQDFIHGNAPQVVIDLVRATASFPEPNLFGIYMSALTPLIIGLAFFYYKGGKRIVMLLAGISGCAGIYLTLSRGSGLGLFLALFFLIVASKKKLLALALIAILVVFPFVMPKKIKDWAKEVNYNPLVFMCNQDRLCIYENTINMIKQHPFIGVGVNTFSKNYGKYKLKNEAIDTGDSIYAHNMYLQMSGETGLIGLGAFIFFLFQVFRYAVKVYRRLKDNYYKIVSVSLLACIIAFLINGLTETSLYYPRISMIFWYLIGVSLSLGKFTGSAEGSAK